MRSGTMEAVARIEEVVTTSAEKVVMVKMSERDASDILGIAHWIGGDPEQARGAMDRPYQALARAGVNKSEVKPKDETLETVQGRMFYYTEYLAKNG